MNGFMCMHDFIARKENVLNDHDIFYVDVLFTRVSVIGRELRERDTKNSISIGPTIFVLKPKKTIQR